MKNMPRGKRENVAFKGRERSSKRWKRRMRNRGMRILIFFLRISSVKQIWGPISESYETKFHTATCALARVGSCIYIQFGGRRTFTRDRKEEIWNELRTI